MFGETKAQQTKQAQTTMESVNGGTGGDSTVSEQASTLTSENYGDEQELDVAQKARMQNYVRTELFKRNYPIINEETYKQVPEILKNAANHLNIAPGNYLTYKTSIRKAINEKLNNLRSYIKKQAINIFHGK